MEFNDGDLVCIHCACGKTVSKFIWDDYYKTSLKIDVEVAQSKGYRVTKNYPAELAAAFAPCPDRGESCILSRNFNLRSVKQTI